MIFVSLLNSFYSEYPSLLLLIYWTIDTKKVDQHWELQGQKNVIKKGTQNKKSDKVLGVGEIGQNQVKTSRVSSKEN